MRPHPIVVSALTMVCAVAPSWKVIPTPDIIDKVCKDPEMRKEVKIQPYIYCFFKKNPEKSAIK